MRNAESRPTPLSAHHTRAVRHRLRIFRAALAWFALCGALACDAHADSFTFAALGDTPYTAEEEAGFIAMIAEMNREKLAFAVHVGDFKNGHSDCGDEVFLQRKEWFELSHHPFIYVPGDNDWTDCWRSSAGGYSPRERLQRLREIFFAEASTLGQRRLAVASQAATDPRHPYPEHARWTRGRVLFVTVNVPGSNNNFARDRSEFRQRDAAVREWIAESFRIARKQRLGAVVLMMQANPWAATGAQRHGYVPLLEALTAETLSFRGEVVLIHGDTHRYRVDRPLLHPETRRPIANFTRIEVFGSPGVNWVRIRVDDTGEQVRFEATPGS